MQARLNCGSSFNETHCSGPRRLGRVCGGEKTRVNVQRRTTTCKSPDVPSLGFGCRASQIKQRATEPESVRQSGRFLQTYRLGKNKALEREHTLCFSDFARRTHSLYFFIELQGLPRAKVSWSTGLGYRRQILFSDSLRMAPTQAEKSLVSPMGLTELRCARSPPISHWWPSGSILEFPANLQAQSP